MPIGTPVHINTVSANTGDNEIVLTVGAGGVPAGATIWVAVSGGEGITSGVSVSDDGSNTYVRDEFDDDHAAATLELHLFSASNVTALAENDTITVSLGASVSSRTAIGAYATGLATTSPVDQKSVAESADSTDAVDSGDITTTVANSILIGAAARATGFGSGFTDAGTDWTEIDQSDDDGNGRQTILAYRIVSSTVTDAFEPTNSSNVHWTAIVANYKEASGAPAQNLPGALMMVGI